MAACSRCQFCELHVLLIEKQISVLSAFCRIMPGYLLLYFKYFVCNSYEDHPEVKADGDGEKKDSVADKKTKKEK